MLISHCNYSAPEINSWLTVFIQYNIVLYKEILSSRKTRVPTNVAAFHLNHQMQVKLVQSSAECKGH